jgi:hypothetical protein
VSLLRFRAPTSTAPLLTKDDYFTVYPSASMTYSPSEKNQLQISFSRRVDRPGIDQTKLEI